MKSPFLFRILLLTPLFFKLSFSLVYGQEARISEDSEYCLECHTSIHHGIVEDWKNSRHAKITPAEGMKLKGEVKRISAQKIPKNMAEFVVGCAECHTINPETHEDTFEHNDFQIHVVVTPGDCSVCHPVEVDQYGDNLMAHAYGNLQDNPIYRSLVDSINGIHSFKDMKIEQDKPSKITDADSCFFCHGTKIEVKGMETVETAAGEMSFPVLSGWPNQGVGRINPDGTMGSCSACHTRHQFSIETARKPFTCSECHKGPDVPAYSVYSVSKHGNIYNSQNRDWNFTSVPWTVAKDFTAPTCATCHISLVVNEDRDILAERTHRMNDRLPWRIFGPIYAHAHPKSPDTTIIRNKSGLSIPVELTGEPAQDYLINTEEQDERLSNMKQACMSCHSTTWVNGHFDRLENTIQGTNDSTLASTKILFKAWELGVARGLAQKDSIFNEGIEKMWIEQWLFYANSTRFASAMAGADYGAFANGRWNMSKNIQEMIEYLERR